MAKKCIKISFLFQVPESQFKGSWAANFNGISTSLPQEPAILESTQPIKETSSHDIIHCLSCMDISDITGLHLSRRSSVESNDSTTVKNDAPDKNVKLLNVPGKSETPPSGSVLEKLLKGKRGEAITTKEKGLIKREILRLVVNLSSAVTSKSHQQSLRR